MLHAIVSDIHANIEALAAVMQDIAVRRVERIFCLGDLVGYGPDPNDVIEVAMDLNGYAVTLSDTAGLRAAEDAIEGEGVRRAQAAARSAEGSD